MFLAIFNDTYSEVKEEGLKTNPVIIPYLKKIFTSKCCCKKKRSEDDHTDVPVSEFKKATDKIVGQVHQNEILSTFFEVMNEPTSEKIKK